MRKICNKIFYCALICFVFSCINKTETNELKNKLTIDGMVWIPGGVYEQGASQNDKMALPHEKPKHSVRLTDFIWTSLKLPMPSFQDL